MASSSSNNPSLVAKALAKAQSVESRLNALVGTGLGTPVQPTIVYTDTQTIITTSANGAYSWTCPAGVTSALIECWGAGGGGGGGSTGKGGEGGGGGAYAAEPLFVTVPGNVYNYIVGDGGSGGAGGGGTGSSGGDSSFNNDNSDGSGNHVYAHGGDYTEGPFIGGNGGNGSANTISHRGGNGGGDGSQSTGGCGGGGSSGMTGTGSDATDSSSSTGSPGGNGGSGGGANGGHGGNSGVSGLDGSSPGGGGGGVGANSATTSLSKVYNASGCRSYKGSDCSPSSNNNTTRQTNGTMWHGGTTDGGGIANGTQKSIITFPTSPNIVSDFSGYTATACQLTLTNQHTYYSTGMNLEFRTWLVGGGAPNTWNGSSSSGSVNTSSINEGQTKVFNLSAAIGQGFMSGTNFGMSIGPGSTPMDNYWYGYFYGAASSNPPKLSLTGVTGATVSGGDGADGQVQITYTTANTTLVASVQPLATSDDTGNALAAGFTALVPGTPASPPYGATPGGITAINPSSSPAVLETWHTIGTASSTIGSGFNISGANSGQPLQFMLGADGNVYLNGVVNCSSGTAENSLTVFTLPPAWRPNRSCFINYMMFPYSASNAAVTWFATLNTSGVCTIGFPATTTITAVIFATYFPLNSNTS